MDVEVNRMQSYKPLLEQTHGPLVARSVASFNFDVDHFAALFDSTIFSAKKRLRDYLTSIANMYRDAAALEASRVKKLVME